MAADPLSEESCSVVITQGDGKVDYGKVDGLKVRERDPNAALSLGADKADVVIKGIVCWRSEARFAKHDYLVARQYPLYMKSEHEDEARSRTAALEYASAGFRVRLLDGLPWSAAEQEEIRQRGKDYNSTIDDVPAKTMESVQP